MEAVDASARGFVLKEAPLTDLLRAIETVAGGGTYVDSVLAGTLANGRATGKLAELTERERDVLRLLADGNNYEQIGQQLFIASETVRTHVQKAMRRLDADTRTTGRGDRPSAEAHRLMGLQTPRGPLRVLIAEDEAAVRELLAESIRGEPEFVLVGAASDATEAIMFAAVEQPDVVLLDVRMPGGGGLAAAKGIRRRSPGSKMIALSGNGDRATVLEMLQVGVVGYLVKGGPIDEIIEAIKGAPEGHGSLSTNVASDVISELTGRLNVQARIESRRSASERRIRRAFEDESALAMVFQPIVALHGRKIVGVEALARFAGPPKRGPDVWFAEAAAVGLGVDLELAAVRKAIEALPHFPPSLYLSVNVSPATLMKDGFYKLVSNVECERLVAEVTEHARIDDYERLAAKVGALRALGMRLAVDDAGAGFSSLRHILNLSPDLIKLDLTLTRDINLDRSKQALAAGLITFAEKTGAAILAEGIETAAEMKALVGLGVSYGQGWFLGKPAPIPLPRRSNHRPSSELIEARERWSL